MLYHLQAVKDNLRNRNGKRIFYLGQGDRLTSEAQDFLAREHIEIVPAQEAKKQRYQLLGGGFIEEKPEHMTHLNGDVLVSKTHPGIVFRGAMDTLEAELLLCQLAVPTLEKPLQEMLDLARKLVACDVLGEPVPEQTLCGLTQEQLRSHSHLPQKFYGQPHFMPAVSDGKEILQLNRIRCAVREAELKAVAAVPDRTDILRALNRMSSMVYILMIREKSGNHTPREFED